MNRPSRRQKKRQRVQRRWREQLGRLRFGLDGMRFESVTVSAQIRDYGWRLDVGYTSTFSDHPWLDAPMVKRYLQIIRAEQMRKDGLERALASVSRNAERVHDWRGLLAPKSARNKVFDLS